MFLWIKLQKRELISKFQIIFFFLVYREVVGSYSLTNVFISRLPWYSLTLVTLSDNIAGFQLTFTREYRLCTTSDLRWRGSLSFALALEVGEFIGFHFHEKWLPRSSSSRGGGFDFSILVNVNLMYSLMFVLLYLLMNS